MRDSNGDLCFESVRLQDIAAEVGTPVYVYSARIVRENVRTYQEAIKASGLKNFRTCFAVKANDNLAVLALMRSLDVSMDVVSIGEMRKVLAAGISASNVVFSGVGKSRFELKQALELGVGQMNVESVEELGMLSDVAGCLGITAKVALRVNPDVDAKTLDKISTGRKNDKFGIPISEIVNVFERKLEWPHLNITGLAVHIGSQLMDLIPFETAYRKLAMLIDELNEMGHKITDLDLGGGVGVAYGEQSAPSISEYIGTVSRVFGNSGLHLTIEPGRSLIASAGVLLSHVNLVKRTQAHNFIVLDAGMNDFLRPAMYNADHPLTHVGGGACERAEMVADVVGPICESTDFFMNNVCLPEPKEGDFLVFGMAGAYGRVMASGYNARLLVPEVLVHDGDFETIRPRQLMEDMIAADHIPSWL